MQIEGYADESRITQLVLTKPVDDIMTLMTPDFARRFLARTIFHLPILRRYVDVFTEAATIHFGAQRLGDQIGLMLAGAYIMAITKDLTVSEALE